MAKARVNALMNQRKAARSSVSEVSQKQQGSKYGSPESFLHNSNGSCRWLGGTQNNWGRTACKSRTNSYNTCSGNAYRSWHYRVGKDWLKYQNKEIKEELQENIDRKFTIDDFSQYVPMAATYGLNLCGVKGKHGYGDLTIILGTAYALMGVTVNVTKNLTKVERPDWSARNSFPSGHTATAFMGAELLRREYWNVSPWIGIAGYAVAAETGFFRIYNNRHWLTDVLAGAGVGILSVQAAYWLYPAISKTFFHKQYLKNTLISPYMSEQSKGLSCTITF